VLLGVADRTAGDEAVLVGRTGAFGELMAGLVAVAARFWLVGLFSSRAHCDCVLGLLIKVSFVTTAQKEAG